MRKGDGEEEMERQGGGETMGRRRMERRLQPAHSQRHSDEELCVGAGECQMMRMLDQSLALGVVFHSYLTPSPLAPASSL